MRKASFPKGGVCIKYFFHAIKLPRIFGMIIKGWGKRPVFLIFLEAISGFLLAGGREQNSVWKKDEADTVF